LTIPVAVELYAERNVLLGTVEIGRRRLSDYLNDATVDMVVLEEAWIGDLTNPEAQPGRLAPATFRKQDVIVAALLDRLEPPAMRSGFVRTTTVNIAASAGPYYLAGDLHLPPNQRFDVRRLFGPGTRTFVPLTNVRISHFYNPSAASQQPALLVRADQVEFAGLVADPAASSLPLLGTMLQERLRILAGRSHAVEARRPSMGGPGSLGGQGSLLGGQGAQG
jgi:hypothetical protein